MRPPPLKPGRGKAPEAAPAWGPPAVLIVDLAPPDGEAAHAPRVAAFADPWPGRLAIYRGNEGGGFRLAGTLTRPATMGRLSAPLGPGPAGIFDRGNAIEVTLFGGALAGLPEIDVLAGRNAAAVRSLGGAWEIVQFVEAELVGPLQYRLTRLLRGQCGSEHAAAAGAAAGADFVLLDAAVAPLDLRPDQVGTPLRWRFGPARDDHAAPSFAELTVEAEGVGLKPFAPVHLRASREASSGDIALSWIRRTRFGGDGWAAADVPLNEEREAYRLEILDGTTLRRTIETSSPEHSYTAAEQAEDFGGPASAFTARIAQLSAAAGAGHELEEVVHV
jgi:hypothetical protein